MWLERIDKYLREQGIPIDGLSLLGSDVREVQIHFRPEASQEHRSRAAEIVTDFDWSEEADTKYKMAVLRTQAQACLVQADVTGILVRAVISVLVDELNSLRAALLPPLSQLELGAVLENAQAIITSGAADSPPAKS